MLKRTRVGVQMWAIGRRAAPISMLKLLLSAEMNILTNQSQIWGIHGINIASPILHAWHCMKWRRYMCVFFSIVLFPHSGVLSPVMVCSRYSRYRFPLGWDNKSSSNYLHSLHIISFTHNVWTALLLYVYLLRFWCSFPDRNLRSFPIAIKHLAHNIVIWSSLFW